MPPRKLPAFLPATTAPRGLVPEGEDPSVLDERSFNLPDYPAALAWSRDGRSLLTIAAPNRSDSRQEFPIRIWDAATGRELQRHSYDSISVAGAPLGYEPQRLAAAPFDAALLLWEFASGGRISQPLPSRGSLGLLALSGTGRLAYVEKNVGIYISDIADQIDMLYFPLSEISCVEHLSFSPNSSYLSFIIDGNVRVFDIETGNELISSYNPEYSAKNITWAPNSESLAIALNGGQVDLLNISSEHIYFQIEDSERIDILTFSPDGQLLAIATMPDQYSRDYGIRLWDIAAGQERGRWYRHSQTVSAMAFSPDGKFLATAASDQTLRLMDVASGIEVRRIEMSPYGFAVDVSADGNLLAVSGGTDRVRLFDLSAGAEIGIFQIDSGTIFKTKFSPDGKLLITTGTTSYSNLLVWDIAERQLRHSLSLIGYTIICEWSRNSQLIATYSDNEYGSINFVELWDVATGKRVQTFYGHSGYIGCIAFSPDSLQLATCSADHTVRIWDCGSGQVLQTLPAPGHIPSELAFSPDGRQLAAVHGDELVLWDVQTGEKNRALPLSKDAAATLAFHQHGETLGAWVWGPEGLRFWDVQTEAEPTNPLSLPRGRYQTRTTRDGDYLWTAMQPREVRFFDRKQGALLFQLHCSSTGWIWRREDKLYRWDDGRLLARLAGDGSRSPVLPPRPEKEPELTATVHVKNPLGEGAAVGELTVVVRNAPAAGRAYWLRLSAVDLPAEANLLAPEPTLLLEPGDTVPLSLSVSAPSRTSPNGREPPQPLMFRVQLDHAFGEGPMLSVVLPRRSAAPPVPAVT